MEKLYNVQQQDLVTSESCIDSSSLTYPDKFISSKKEKCNVLQYLDTSAGKFVF